MVLVTTVLLYAVLASAWNIIGGMAGQLDLAAAAYLGLGAFTTGTLLIRWNITPWIGMIIGGRDRDGSGYVDRFPLVWLQSQRALVCVYPHQLWSW